MGLLVFVGLVAAMVVLIAFALYGVLLGMAQLGHECKRLFWPQLPDVQRPVTEARLPQAVLARAGEQRCWDVKECLAGQKEHCPAFKKASMPCWLAQMQARKDYTLKPDCVACTEFSLPALLN